MMYNKQGTKFAFRVSIDRDPAVDPTYSHKFPTMSPRGVVVERWSTKVRPIKSMTSLLRGMNLKRNVDYMIDYNSVTQKYDYYFLDHGNATWFSLVCGGMKQLVQKPNHTFNVVCPHCQQDFPTKDITWK